MSKKCSTSRKFTNTSRKICTPYIFKAISSILHDCSASTDQYSLCEEMINKQNVKYVSTDILTGLFSGELTHWGQVTHICVVKLTIIGSDNGLLPGRRQAIIWTNAGILLIRPLGTNFSEILIGIKIFSFKKMRLKMSSAKWRPFCLGLNVLNYNTSPSLNLSDLMVQLSQIRYLFTVKFCFLFPV